VCGVTAPRTVLFMPEAAFGPTNQCIGLGAVLAERGFRVVFAAESSWAGKLQPFGFEEHLVDLAEPSEQDVDAGQFWADFIRDTAPEFRKPTVDQIESFLLPTWQAIVAGARYAQPRLLEILADVAPDVIVEDNVVAFPALTTDDAPFVRVVSCNPLEVPGADIAPVFSGLPSADRAHWSAFRVEYDRVMRPLWADFNEWVVSQGAASLPDLEFIHTSDVANIYLYPDEADYLQARPMDASWHRMDSSVRETDDAYPLPDAIRDRRAGSALIYLSLGSLGSADVGLMRRLIDILSRTPHRYIVSKGPQHQQFELAPNMVGAPTLPQTRVIPQVDLVITHGGNNTTTECLHFGKPMVLLPLFWDQYDNAQRMDELGFGIRLPTYTCSADELTGAVDALLADTALNERLRATGERIRARDGLRTGAKVIADVAERAR
jgi:MGT family glycosyltransferase